MGKCTSRHLFRYGGLSKSTNLQCSKSIVTNIIINNGNRTEWSPIRSVINKIGRPRSGCPIGLIASMITQGSK